MTMPCNERVAPSPGAVAQLCLAYVSCDRTVYRVLVWVYPVLSGSLCYNRHPTAVRPTAVLSFTSCDSHAKPKRTYFVVGARWLSVSPREPLTKYCLLRKTTVG